MITMLNEPQYLGTRIQEIGTRPQQFCYIKNVLTMISNFSKQSAEGNAKMPREASSVQQIFCSHSRTPIHINFYIYLDLISSISKIWSSIQCSFSNSSLEVMINPLPTGIQCSYQVLLNNFRSLQNHNKTVLSPPLFFFLFFVVSFHSSINHPNIHQ